MKQAGSRPKKEFTHKWLTSVGSSLIMANKLFNGFVKALTPPPLALDPVYDGSALTLMDGAYSDYLE